MSSMSSMSRLTGSASATPKSLVRRPTLTRKRNESANAEPPSSGKRSKVTFDSDVEVRIMGAWEKAPGLIQEEVRRALEKHALGDDAGYDQVKAIYSAKESSEEEPSPLTIRNYTLALLGSASSLNKNCSDLVHLVISSEWLGRTVDYIELFVRLLAHLVTAQGVFLADVLRMLVENLTTTPPSNARLPNLPVVPRSQIHLRTHRALQYLLQLIPSASRVLSSIVTNTFPHETDSRRAHVTYVQNLLKISAYAPELQAEVLALITERLVKIDVQVQVDLEEIAEDMDDGLVQGLPRVLNNEADDMDSSDSSDNESDISDDETEDADARRSKDITRNVEKMDAILDLLFVHYDNMLVGSSIEDQAGPLDILLSQFVTTILPTHRSRHTQFLLFHFAQLSPISVDTFVGTCVQIAFDRGQPAMVRQAAAAYLASFVARGIHVPSSIVRDVFDYIGSELDRLRRDYDPNCRGPDPRRYASYYALVQALLYIFCFRWRDLELSQDEDFEDEDLPGLYGEEHQWMSGVKETLSLNVFSKLNPLKVCSPAIVTEFARIANHLGVIYVFHLLETNKRIRLSQFSGYSRSDNAYGHPDRETALSVIKDESHQHLDEYFPFDPYHLPKSKRWIEGDYRAWTGVPGLEDDSAAESESDEDEDAASEVEEGTETDETSSIP